MPSKYHRLDFKSFPRVWGLIVIPENHVVYRGGTRPPQLSTDPRFFSDFPTASEYTRLTNEQKGAQTYKTFACVTKEIKLVDLRTLRYLLQEYVGHNRLLFDDEELKLVKKTMFALGLMSLKEQYEYIKQNQNDDNGLSAWIEKFPSLQDVYNSVECEFLSNAAAEFNVDNILTHYTAFGNRISDCSIDDEMVAVLKNVVGDTVDGYIAPEFDTVWHSFRFNPELCLFDPSASLKFCKEVPKGMTNPDVYVPPIDINDILLGYSMRIAGEGDLMKGGSRDGVTFEGTCKMKTKKEDPTEALPKNFAYEGNSAIAKVNRVWKQETIAQHTNSENGLFTNARLSNTANVTSNAKVLNGSKRSNAASTPINTPTKFGLSEEL